MSITPKPILLSFEMPSNLFITSFRPVGGDAINPWEWKKKNPLPQSIFISADYNPRRLYLLTESKIKENAIKWSTDGQWQWSDAPINVRNNIFQGLIKKYMIDSDRKNLTKNDWILEGPNEVKDFKNSIINIFLCAQFSYSEINGKDAIIIEIKRKVQSAKSLWEEHQDGLFVFNNDTQALRVKVAIASEIGTMSSKWFKGISDLNLNGPAYDGTKKSMVDYWRENGHEYTKEAANKIPQIIVSGNQRYPADQVYRVMSIDQWSAEVKQKMNKYLNLTPNKYLSYVRKGMSFLNGWKIKSYRTKKEWNLGSTISYSWHSDWEVKHSDSRKILTIPGSTIPFLDKNYKWHHHLKKFEQFHSRPPPSIDIYYITTKNLEKTIPELRKHADQIFSNIPHWNDMIYHHQAYIIPSDNQVISDEFIHKFIKKISSSRRSILVISALPPKCNNDFDLYKCLKYNLTEAGIVHQNFKGSSPNRLNISANYASGLVNAMQMLLKHGILPVPYSCNIGDIDIIAALDIGRIGSNKSVAAIAVSMTKEGILWGTNPKSEPQRGETMSSEVLYRTFSKLIREYEEKVGKKPKKIMIIRDGNTPKQEKISIKKIIKEYSSLEVEVCWISLRKSGAPRLLNFENNKIIDDIPNKGHWMSNGFNSAWIWPTGSPMQIPGIPQSLGFDIEFNFEKNPIKIGDAARLLIAHAHASQITPWSSTRLPFVHHLSDKMAKAMINGQIPLDQNGNKFSAA